MARTINGKDVIIRVVAIGDEGRNHLDVLREVATPSSVARESHALPLLQELETDGITFCVFPLVFDAGYDFNDTRAPWYARVSEVLEVMRQLLQVSTLWTPIFASLSMIYRASRIYTAN